MSNSENAILYYEAGQNSVAMSALTDSGDLTIFNFSGSPISQRSGYAPVVRVDGIRTGGEVTAAVSGSNDVVDVSALTAFVAGLDISLAAQTDESITRPATAVSKVNSITLTSAGAISVVAGTDGATTAFSETRGAAGGPPYIPTTSIELAQIRVISDTAAPIAASEIFSVVGQHRELSSFPGYNIDYFDGTLTFDAALSPAHTGDVAKAVHASYATPIFADAGTVTDFVPAETSHSISSSQFYRKTLGSKSTSLGQASFTAAFNNGITDTLVGLKDENLWFKFQQDIALDPYILTQGYLGMSRTFSPSENVSSNCTISAAEASREYAS
jgi:hypothetical protein